LPLERVAGIRALLADCPEALAEARKLRLMPKGRMPIKYAPDFVSTIVEPVQHARTVCAFLQCDAALRTHDGDFDGALESCRAMHGLYYRADEVGSELDRHPAFRHQAQLARFRERL